MASRVARSRSQARPGDSETDFLRSAGSSTPFQGGKVRRWPKSSLCIRASAGVRVISYFNSVARVSVDPVALEPENLPLKWHLFLSKEKKGKWTGTRRRAFNSFCSESPSPSLVLSPFFHPSLFLFFSFSLFSISFLAVYFSYVFLDFLIIFPCPSLPRQPCSFFSFERYSTIISTGINSTSFRIISIPLLASITRSLFLNLSFFFLPFYFLPVHVLPLFFYFFLLPLILVFMLLVFIPRCCFPRCVQQRRSRGSDFCLFYFDDDTGSWRVLDGSPEDSIKGEISYKCPRLDIRVRQGFCFPIRDFQMSHPCSGVINNIRSMLFIAVRLSIYFHVLFSIFHSPKIAPSVRLTILDCILFFFSASLFNSRMSQLDF